jgi:hypothetical protein
MFSLQQNRKTRGWNRFCLEVRRMEVKGGGDVGQGAEMAQAMHTHMNKCISNFKSKNLKK